MRVEVVESPIENQAVPDAFSDAAVDRALKTFLAAVTSDDSLFIAESSGVTIGIDSRDGPKTCWGTFTVSFREERQASSRAFHFSLIEKLSELLKAAGSSESLGIVLCLVSEKSKGDQASALALWMRLGASGSSQEQAGLRWGLGLAHLQQALLFLSRYLRQQIGQSGD